MFNRLKNYKRRIPFPFIDIYLFQWNTLNPSGIHDHAKNGCYMFLLKGSIKENIYNRTLTKTKTNTNLYTAPYISYINDNIGYHCIEPLERSISIHFYHPKNHKIKIF